MKTKQISGPMFTTDKFGNGNIANYYFEYHFNSIGYDIKIHIYLYNKETRKIKAFSRLRMFDILCDF